jgi:hypothetical protein
MSFSSFPLLGLIDVKLLLVTVPDVFSAREEMYVAIIVKESKSDINVFKVVLNT